MKYSLSPREIPRGKPKGFPEGSGIFCIVFPDSNHSTDILNYKFSIDLLGRSILAEMILRIAWTAGQYGKMLTSRMSNTGELRVKFQYYNVY